MIWLVFLTLLMMSGYADGRTYTQQELEQIGKAIWYNESGKSYELLTYWNEKESFPSFGIGHFIWLPPDHSNSLEQTFPALINFLRSRGLTIPARANGAFPWKDRAQFMREFHEAPMIALREFLHKTIPDQTLFIIQLFEQTVARITSVAPTADRVRIEKNLSLLQQTPQGLFALIDYHNFKGSGLNLNERYHGKGWGLLQVLLAMESVVSAQDAVRSFVRAAKNVLEARVANHQEDRRFLPGWLKRVEGYGNK